MRAHAHACKRMLEPPVHAIVAAKSTHISMRGPRLALYLYVNFGPQNGQKINLPKNYPSPLGMVKGAYLGHFEPDLGPLALVSAWPWWYLGPFGPQACTIFGPQMVPNVFLRTLGPILTSQLSVSPVRAYLGRKNGQFWAQKFPNVFVQNCL